MARTDQQVSVRLRLRSGERAERRLGPGEQMELYAEAVHRGRAGLVESVAARREEGRLVFGDRRARENYLEAGDRTALRAFGERASARAVEAFVTPATLEVPAPRNDAVAELGVAWIDIDADPRGPRPAGWPAWIPFEVAMERLRAFGRRPHLVVSSGSGGVHAYWRFATSVSAERGERANRQLAAHLGGDHQSTNRARIMRLPGSWNRKPHPSVLCRIVWCDLAHPGHRVDELTAGLGDPKAPRRRTPAGRGREWDGAGGDLPPPVYFARIAGIAVDERGGLISCPHAGHEDRHPSCKVYPNPGEGWTCFACGAGGGPIDLVSALEGGPTGSGLRGEQFKRAERECRARLGIAPAQMGGARRRKRRTEEVRG